MLKITIPGLFLAILLCNSSCQTTTDAKTSAKIETPAGQTKTTETTENPSAAATSKVLRFVAENIRSLFFPYINPFMFCNQFE